jgi:hypothetical protein
MKKVLIVCTVALAIVCMFNVKFASKSNSGKTTQIVSLNKALADGEIYDGGTLPAVTVYGSDGPPATVDLGVPPPGIVDIGPNPPIDLGDPAETLKNIGK